MKRVLTSFQSSGLHPAGADPWVWDAAQQVLATQGAVYVQGHCLQALGPLQEHTTFRESLVCYTSQCVIPRSAGSIVQNDGHSRACTGARG